MDPLVVLFAVAGVFTIALGLVHVVLPLGMDLDASVPLVGPELKVLRLWRVTYAVRRQDVRGITWVMNHAASYVLITAGVVDLAAVAWLGTDAGRWLAVWLTGWWMLRAGTQLMIGRRRIDLFFVALFGSLAIVHLAAALR